MPVYFFDFEGLPNSEDEEGTLLAGPEQARAEAVAAAGELLKDADGAFWDAPEWRLHVRDVQGATICTLTIKGTTGES